LFNLYDIFDRSLEDLLLKAFGKKYKVPCKIRAANERIQVVNTGSLAFSLRILRLFGIVFVTVFHQILKKKNFFAKIECGLYFLNRFDVLMSKMIFKK